MPRPLRWVTVWAAVFLVAIGTVWYSQAEAGRRTCERGNEFRSEDLPAAFAEYTRLLGEEFEAPPERVESAVATFDDRLDELFPTRNC